MVETISPVVYGTRTRWATALALHAAGAAATAAAFGAAVAAAGALLGAPWGRAGAAIVAAIAALYLVRELTGARIPVPQLRRQVPDWWRTYFGWPVAAFLYGAGLGVGFFTYLGHGTLVVVTVGAAASGRPLLGALVVAPFGIARGVAPLVGARSAAPEDGRRLVDRLSSMPVRVRSIPNAVALTVVAGTAVGWGWRARGGWAEAAAAVLALSFGWAAASKLAGWRRWRRALSSHALSPALERVAAVAVPALETLVTALALAGWDRGAAAVALACLTAFTIDLVRPGVRDGGRVACGCFGQASVDLRAAVARNLALAAVAAAVWLGGRSVATIPVPGGTDLVAALLVAGGLAVAALTAWRAGTWLHRGRA